MIVITKITKKKSGVELISTPVWYEGSYKFEFYNTVTKEIFSRSMDMYRAKRFFEQEGILYPSNLYVSISKRCLKLADYIDYVGVWNREDLSKSIQSELFKAKSIAIRYLDDDLGFFVSITDGFHVQDLHMSIVEGLFKLSHTRIGNSIFVSGMSDVAYEYKIEDVKNFDILYTKLNCLGVGR